MIGASCMKTIIGVLTGLLLLALVFSRAGMPIRHIGILTSVYATAAMFLCFCLPIAWTPGAAIAIRGALAHIRRQRPYDPKALRRACWILRKNEDIRQLGQLVPSDSIPEDLLRRVERALPLLEMSAGRKAAILKILMFACMIGGALCRFIGSMQHH